MDDPTIQAARNAVESFNRLGETIVRELEPHLAAFVQSVREVYDWMWERYREAGMPHGDSEEGMQLWFGQIAAAQRLQQRINDERSWAVALDQVRQVALNRRASRA